MSNNKYPNSGILSRNERRRPDTKDPEYSGSINVDGKDYWLSAWVKDGQRGKFFSLSVKPKESAPAQSAAPAAVDDEIPF